MSRLRVEKVQELMKQEISQIILREMKDPRIGFVTVTQVRMSGDLSHGEVFLSLMGSDEEKSQTMKALEKSLGFIRSEIGKRIRLRHTPSLVFKMDDTLEYSANIQRLLLEIDKEKKHE